MLENKRFFGRISYLHRQMRRENSCLFSEYGITPIHMHVLVFVEMQTIEGKSVCQKDIEKHVNLRASSMSSLLGTLEKNGLIVRTVAEGDARTKYVTLTDKGKSICVKNKLLIDRCDDVIQSALSQDEQEMFIELLNKIITAIEKEVK